MLYRLLLCVFFLFFVLCFFFFFFFNDPATTEIYTSLFVGSVRMCIRDSQTTTHMHGHHEATMGLAGVSLGRELRALALSHTASVRRGTA